MKSVAYYQKLVEQAWGKSEKWRKEAKEVWTTYNDARRFNVLYSNTDLLLGALASPSPKPVIRVRFAKQTDGSESERTLARTAAEAAERAVVYNNDQFDRDFARKLRATNCAGNGFPPVDCPYRCDGGRNGRNGGTHRRAESNLAECGV